MGQKVNPIGLRLGIVKEWSSKWYADKKDYAKFLKSDYEIRTYLYKNLAHAALSSVQIERPSSNAVVTLHSARPGIIIGRKGEDIDKLKVKLSKIAGMPVHVNIEEVRKPELDAKLIGDSIAQQLEKRVMFRRAMKRAVTNAMRAGAKGIKVAVSGRLSGAEIARTEWYHEGRVPLHTLRADIDYTISEAMTTYGVIGIKVWVFKGEKLESQV